MDLNGQNIKTKFDDISRITTCMIYEVSDIHNEVVCSETVTVTVRYDWSKKKVALSNLVSSIFSTRNVIDFAPTM